MNRMLFPLLGVAALATAFFAGRVSVTPVTIAADPGAGPDSPRPDVVTEFVSTPRGDRPEGGADPVPRVDSPSADTSTATAIKPDWRREPSSARDRAIQMTHGNVTEALEMTDPVERMRLFTSMLADLTAESAPMAMAALDSLPDGYERGRERGLLLYAWAKLDGPSAIEYAQRNGRGWERHRNAYSVLNGWATEDPEAAEAWAREAHDGEDNPYLAGVIAGVAGTDLDKATELTYTLPYGRNRGHAVDALIGGYFRQSPEAAMDWAEQLPEKDLKLKEGIYTRVASKIANIDGYRAAEWVLDSAEGDVLMRALPEVADEWAERNPGEAADWVDRLEDGELKSRAMGEVISEWARKEPAKAADWLNAQPKSELLDRPIERFAWNIRHEDPQTAMVWAGQITGTEQRRKLLENLAADWMKRDPENARQFLR